MSYLKEFQKEIQKRDFDRFLLLWEEYCTNDVADPEEILSLLQMVKGSDFMVSMGNYIETIIPLLNTLQDQASRWQILKLLFDIQTTNTEELFEIGNQEAEVHFLQHPQFQDLLRRVGLRKGGQFQGALSQLELLTHFQKGNYVVHWGAFGVGEIMELSFIREILTIEFEKAQGLKSVTFATALKSLEPLSQEHFLVRRFSFAEEMEKLAKEDPLSLIRDLLRDLGPKTAQEIKEELSGYIIQEDQWSRFWQNVRAKIKKDLSFESPENAKEPFLLRKQATSHIAQFQATLAKKKKPGDALAFIHTFSKEHPDEIPHIRQEVLDLFDAWAKKEILTHGEKLEIALMKESVFSLSSDQEAILSLFYKDPLRMIGQVDILFYKKVALEKIRLHAQGWQELFLAVLKEPLVSMVREYLVKELMAAPDGEKKLEEFLHILIHHPMKAPDFFFWCFTKNAIDDKKNLPLHDELDQEKWWEGLLLLLSEIERSSPYPDLVKKIMQLINHDRYRYVRLLFKRSSFEYVREFLLLASKCSLLADKDLTNLKALAGVHYPELGISPDGKEKGLGNEVFWATQKGFLHVEARMKQIAEKEMVDVSREIETARGHGDLRENADYKFAKERRARLQGELRRRSQEFQKARIITQDDVSKEEVAIGSVIEAIGEKEEKMTITLLGPWEADPDNDIFSLQSKVGETLIGLKKGDTFSFQNQNYTIKNLKTIFD